MSRDTSKFFHSRRVERGRLGRLLDYEANRGRAEYFKKNHYQYFAFLNFAGVFKSVMYEFYKQIHGGSGLRLH